MISRTALIGMLKTDALRLLRDRFLIGISLYILFIFVAMRAFIPWLTAEIASNGGFDLIPYLPLIVSYIVVQIAPMLPGIIGGFMLLESREEGTAKALLVTPSSYLPVMCVAMIVISVALTVFAGAIIEIAMPSWSAQIAIAFVAAPSAPIFALALATLANIKVQAFAWMKALGIGPLLVVGAWFLPEAWQWLAGIYPPYWASKAFWVAESGGAWAMWAFGGLVTSAIWLEILRRLFLKAASR